MKDLIRELLQGIVVGIANIIPGVSGGTMMVAMGLYDRLLWSITHLFSDFKKSITFLIPIFIGAAIAILGFARLFEYCLTYYPIPTNLAFCGLIAGSLPAIYGHVKGQKTDASTWICCLVFFALVVAGGLLSGSTGADRVLVLNPVNVIILFFIGIISAATMVIPGVSGSMVLMLLGYYAPILGLVNDLLDTLRAGAWSEFFSLCGLLIPFALGVVIGIFAIAKLIEWLLAKWPKQCYWAIIGLIAASPIAILLETDWSTLSVWTLLIGVVCAAAGWFAARLLGEKE